jgi:hypothetical protein
MRGDRGLGCVVRAPKGGGPSRRLLPRGAAGCPERLPWRSWSGSTARSSTPTGKEQWPPPCIDYWIYVDGEAQQARISVKGWSPRDEVLDLSGDGVRDGLSIGDSVARILGVPSLDLDSSVTRPLMPRTGKHRSLAPRGHVAHQVAGICRTSPETGQRLTPLTRLRCRIALFQIKAPASPALGRGRR